MLGTSGATYGVSMISVGSTGFMSPSGSTPGAKMKALSFRLSVSSKMRPGARQGVLPLQVHEMMLLATSLN